MLVLQSTLIQQINTQLEIYTAEAKDYFEQNLNENTKCHFEVFILTFW